MQVSRWGNSLAIRIPAAVVDALGLKEGDEIEVHVAGDRRFAVKRAADASRLLERLRKYRGRLPRDFKFDREETHKRG